MRSFWHWATATSALRATARWCSRRAPWTALLIGIFAAQCAAGEQGSDGDLASATPLLAVPAPPPSQFRPGEEPGSPAIGRPDGAPISNLFNGQPGQMVAMSAMLGIIDPVGTSLPHDFDGDGILNDNETLTNRGVADFPKVQAKIAILETTTSTTEEIVSEI